MSDLHDPRVLFAAERTLLAWNRTSVSLITLGFVIERFGLYLHQTGFSNMPGQRDLSFSIGISLISFATLLSLLSVIQFWRILKSLTVAEFPRGYWVWLAVIANLAVVVLGVVLAIYLINGFN